MAPGVGDDVPPSLQFLFDNFPEKVVYVTKELCMVKESLTEIPKILRNFTMLQRLDISRNLFRTLPVKIMDEYMPKLQALDISHNRMDDMHNVQELGVLRELRELNLLGNPLLVINQRASLIAFLFFDGVRPSRERLESLLDLNSSSTKKGRECQVKPKIIASESTSQMIISGLAVGQELPTHAVKVLSKSKSASSSDYSTVIYADLTSAPVPRPTGTPFRHLSKLNLEIVTKEDLDQAAHACKTQGVDKLAGAQLPAKPKKLTGKAKMHNLEQSLNNIMLEQRKLQVDRTLKKLLRYGTLDKFQPGLAGALAQRGPEEEEPTDGSSSDTDDQRRAPPPEKLTDKLAEDGEDEEDEEILNNVREWSAKPLSVIQSILQDLPGLSSADLDAPPPSSLQVAVTCVEHLPKADIGGTCDTYIKISLGHTTCQTRAVTADESYISVFHENFVLPLLAQQSLEFEVWDRDTASADDLVGNAVMSSANVAKALLRGRPEEVVLQVFNAKGKEVIGETGFPTAVKVRLQYARRESLASTSSLPERERGWAGSTKTLLVPEENRQQRLAEVAEGVGGGRGLGGGERVLWGSAEAAGQTHAAAQEVEPPAPTSHSSNSKKQESARTSTASHVSEASESKAARGWLTTCPRAWWERGSSKEGEREGEELPTRQSVVQMGENELRKTREAVARARSVTQHPRNAHAHLSAGATAADELMSTAGGVVWDNVEDELAAQLARAQQQQRLARTRHSQGAGALPRKKGGTFYSASKSAASLLQGGAGVSETMTFELPSQRDYTNSLINRRLPLQFKRLKLHQFLAEGTKDGTDEEQGEGEGARRQAKLETVEDVSEQLDALFTATNIQNKLESATARVGRRSLVAEARRMKQQESAAEWEARLGGHQARLRVLNSGGWPHATPGLPYDKSNPAAATSQQHPHQQQQQLLQQHEEGQREGGDSAGGGGSVSGGGGGSVSGSGGGSVSGGGGGSVSAGLHTRELAKELTKIERKAMPANADAALAGHADKPSDSHTLHAHLAHQGSIPARARTEASSGAAAGAGVAGLGRQDRPSRAWRVGSDAGERGGEPSEGKAAMGAEAAVLACHIDTILLASGGQGGARGGRTRGGDAGEIRGSGRDAVKQMRHELGAFHETLSEKQMAFFHQRRNVGASVDKLIISRRFGEFGGRKVSVAGIHFE